MVRRCPHKNIQFCPLYIAAHGLQDAGGKWHALGCDDGELRDGSRAVARGMRYARQVEAVRAVWPDLVEHLQFKERAAAEWAEAEQRRVKRLRMLHRSEARRVGKARVSMCVYSWSRYPSIKNTTNK